MAETTKDALGATIIVDDQPNDTKHPSVGSLKEADKVSENTAHDADLNDSPVRTNRPDVPVIQRLGVGAGQHEPLPADAPFDEFGRFNGQPETAKVDEAENKERQKQSDEDAKAAAPPK